MESEEGAAASLERHEASCLNAAPSLLAVWPRCFLASGRNVWALAACTKPCGHALVHPKSVMCNPKTQFLSRLDAQFTLYGGFATPGTEVESLQAAEREFERQVEHLVLERCRAMRHRADQGVSSSSEPAIKELVYSCHATYCSGRDSRVTRGVGSTCGSHTLRGHGILCFLLVSVRSPIGSHH